MAYLYNRSRSPSSSPRSPRPTVVDVPTTLASSSSSSSTSRQLFPLDAHQFGKRCGLCRKEPHAHESHINAITSPCHHIFCHECMLQWILLSKKTVCPLSHCAFELAKVILTKQCPKSRAELVGLMKSFEDKRKGAVERYDSLVYYEGADILDEIKRLVKFKCDDYNFDSINGVPVRNEIILDRQKRHMKQMDKQSQCCKLVIRRSTCAINTLSDDCLLSIFDRVPLCDLLRIDQVCPLWAILLKSACARRRTLALYLSGIRVRLAATSFYIPLNNTFEVSLDSVLERPFYDLPPLERDATLTLPFLVPRGVSFEDFCLYDDQDGSDGFFDILYRTSIGGVAQEELTEKARFHKAHLSGQVATYLVGLFPNVTTLLVIHADCDQGELNLMVDLVKCLRLNILKFWMNVCRIKLDGRTNHFEVATLLHTIKQQSNLQQLTLDIQGAGSSHITKAFDSFTFHDKLVSLKIFVENDDQGIWKTVKRLNSPQLLNVGLGNWNNQTEAVLSDKFDFATKVTQLYGSVAFKSVEQFGEFCWRFPALTNLHINWLPNINFTQLLSTLTSLKHLAHLALDSYGNVLGLMGRNGGEKEKSRRISLPQVKSLTLKLPVITHHVFKALSPLTFPSIEAMVVEISCTVCQNCRLPQPNGRFNDVVVNQCHRLLMAPLLNNFASLLRLYVRRISYGVYVDLSTFLRTEDPILPVLVRDEEEDWEED